MTLKKISNYKYTMGTATEMVVAAWDKVTGTSSDDTLTLSSAAAGTGLVDLGAGNDSLVLNVANQTWTMQLNGVEQITATALNTTLNVNGAGIFNTNGSIAQINCGSGDQKITFTGASADSTINLGSGTDQVYFDAANTKWTYEKTSTGAIVYDVNTGFKVTINGDVEYLKIQNNAAGYESGNTNDVLLSSLSTGDVGGTKVSEAVSVAPITFNSSTIGFTAGFGSGQGYAYAFGRVDGLADSNFDTFNSWVYLGGTMLDGLAQTVTLDPTGNYYFLGNQNAGGALVVDGWLWTYFFSGNNSVDAIDKVTSQGAYRVIVGDNNANITGAMNQSAGDTLGSANFGGYYDFTANKGYAMYGFGGNDVIKGWDNNDTIWGGIGDDTFVGGVGVDELEGEAGDDVFQYATSAAFLTANAVVDSIVGGAGTGDKVEIAGAISIGSSASLARATTVEILAAATQSASTQAHSIIIPTDTKLSGFTTINLSGDSKATSTGVVTLTSVTGNIAITGVAAGNNTLTGGTGNDTITGGSIADTLDGGAGNDIYLYTATSELIASNAVVDLIADTSGTADELKLTTSTDVTILTGDSLARITGVEKITAGPSSGVISITRPAGTNGNFTTIDLSGDTDALGTNVISSTGANAITTIIGSTGVDQIALGAAAPATTINGGPGADTLAMATGTTATIGDGTIAVTITGSGTVTTTAALTATTITGGSGADTITLAGSVSNVATVIGGGGSDIIDLGASSHTGSVTVQFSPYATNGVDTITHFIAGANKDILKVTALDALTDAQNDNSVSTASAATTGANGTTAGSAKAWIVTDAAAPNWSDVATIFANAVDESGTVIDKSAVIISNGTDTRVYLYNNNGVDDTVHPVGASFDATHELVLVGSISGVLASAFDITNVVVV